MIIHPGSSRIKEALCTGAVSRFFRLDALGFTAVLEVIDVVERVLRMGFV
jgi:hypothetical protein